MKPRSEAEDHLRVIRSLMERATVYRAISAPTALAGGFLALATSGAIWFYDHHRALEAPGFDPRLFTEIWLVVVAVVLAINAFFVRREARRDGRIFLSSGARLALRSVAPCLILPAATTIWFFKNAEPIDKEILVSVWIIFYGLSLLATAHFAVQRPSLQSRRRCGKPRPRRRFSSSGVSHWSSTGTSRSACCSQKIFITMPAQLRDAPCL